MRWWRSCTQRRSCRYECSGETSRRLSAISEHGYTKWRLLGTSSRYLSNGVVETNAKPAFRSLMGLCEDDACARGFTKPRSRPPFVNAHVNATPRLTTQCRTTTTHTSRVDT